MRRRWNGYTLIEIFFAIMLVCSVFLALATIIPTALGTVRKGQTTVVATDLARMQMEYYRAQPFATLQGLEGTSIVYPFPDPPTTMPPPGWDPNMIYTVTVNVSGQAVTGDANVVQVDITVLWNAGGLTGSQQTTDAYGNPVPAGSYANSSVSLHTQVWNAQNPF